MRRHEDGFTLIELLVVISIIALLIGILLPALGRARMSANMTKCQANCKSVTMAALTYVNSGSGRLPPDERGAAMKQVDNRIVPIGDRFNFLRSMGPKLAPRSWLGRLEAYVGRDPDALDCPLQDNIFKYPVNPPHYFWSDYYMNVFAINVAPEIAQEPSKGMLYTHPNQHRSGVLEVFAEMLAYPGRPDLEDTYTGSMSFGFVDGHAARVPMPPGSLKERTTHGLPDVGTRWGSPAFPYKYSYNNPFSLADSQVRSDNHAIWPPPNNLLNVPSLP